jgi:hypothetical protein
MKNLDGKFPERINVVAVGDETGEERLLAYPGLHGTVDDDGSTSDVAEYRLVRVRQLRKEIVAVESKTSRREALL